MKEKMPDVLGIDCKTRYPLFFVHGMGFRDDSPFYSYWGRITDRLKAHGAEIYFSNHDCIGTLRDNAAKIKERFDELIETEKIEKVNIIAHSKGGIESRLLISSLGSAPHTASLTTFSSPHRGVKAMDLACRIPFALAVANPFVNAYFKLWGDKNPQFKKTVTELSSESMEKFNAENPDDPAVRYFSYAGKMKNSFSDLIFFFTFPIIKRTDGENDGLVPVESAKWGTFKGVIESKGVRGISHADAVDLRRSAVGGLDITDVYVEHVKELKKQGL